MPAFAGMTESASYDPPHPNPLPTGERESSLIGIAVEALVFVSITVGSAWVAGVSLAGR
jgi:hypothetical protein